MRVLETNPAACLVSPAQRGLKVRAQPRHPEDAAAGRDHLAVALRRARVENDDILQRARRFKPGDLVPFCVRTRISAGRHDHARARVILPAKQVLA